MTTPSSTPPAPTEIFASINAFQRTAAIKAAIELDLFTHLAQGQTTPALLARACGADARGLRILCDALCVWGHLQKASDGYRLPADVALFLDRRSPAYIGGAVEFLTAPLNQEAFARFTDAVRAGGTALPGKGAVEDNAAGWVTFARHMGTLMYPAARALAEIIPGEALRKVLDIASGHGIYGIQVALRHPGAQVYALDWPAVLTVGEENATRASVRDRWHLLPGSAFARDWGSGYDLVLMPNFLHHFDAATCESLLRRARAALAPGGRLAIVEFVVSDDRLTPPAAALFPLIMLATTPAGDAYTYAELEVMCRAAGFTRTRLQPLPPAFQSLVLAE